MTEINNTPTHKSDIPIECSKVRKCGWKGMHSDLVDGGLAKGFSGTLRIKQLVCPNCGNDSYYTRDVGAGESQ
ncbi:hypothetical protein [Burkholderia sp. BCC1988]|uniref:hypothetical protein n=1 Tax=Burkholderia sp. BCC1988 TaxID=2817443 RepID=UPI002AB323E8|nr:hypothetical protein [Burkholderia sp. BCC1988]